MATAILAAWHQHSGPAHVADIDAYFKGGRNRQDTVAEILETLVAVGQLRETADGRFVL